MTSTVVGKLYVLRGGSVATDPAESGADARTLVARDELISEFVGLRLFAFEE